MHRSIFFIAAAMLTGAVPAGAVPSGQMIPVRQLPRDCLSLLTGSRSSELQDWRNMVGVEHCDRIKRLQRISQGLPPEGQPLFYDATILASELPGYVGVSVPILRVVFPERVFFDTDSAEPRPEAREVAEIVAASLRNEPPDVVMFVAGHADARASRAYNAGLSVERANALAETVLASGVNVATVWRVGFGEDLPLAAGDSAEAYGRNRRIEFLFAARPEALATWLSKHQLDETCQGRVRAQADRCRRSLELENSYEVVQVTPPRRTPAAPALPDRGGRGPRAPAGQEATPTGSGPLATSPSRGEPRRIDPVRPPGYSLNLKSRSYGRLY